MYILLGLYALSIIAAVVIIFRSPPQTSKSVTKSAKQFSAITQRNGIGIISIYGAIQFDDRDISVIPGNMERILKRITSYSERDDISAVVLKINSPGGSVAAVQEIYNGILKLRKSGKKVVATMGDVAASGGYYIASAADKIVANPGTLTGSIGVIFTLANFQGVLKKVGVKFETIKSGKMKDIGSFSRDMTDEERTLLQNLINNAYEQFLAAVIQCRSITKEKLLPLADGRIYTGEQAKQIGLIDELGTSEDAINLAAQLAGIKGKPRIVSDSDKWEYLFDILGQSSKNNIVNQISNQQKIKFEYMMY